MLKSIANLIIVTMACVPGVPAAQRGTSSPPSRPDRVLTAEEKEMLKQRELLENLELLQNFEKIRYLDFLAVHKTDNHKSKQAAKPTARNSERKNAKP